MSKQHSFIGAPAHISNEIVSLMVFLIFWKKCILIEVANSQVHFETKEHQDFNV